MARRRGFFAEMQHQAQLASKRAQQQQVAAARTQQAAEREAERARKAAERAAIQADKASAAERKAAEQEALRLRREARNAEVDAMNAQLAAFNDELDSLLAATLAVDDFVDLNTLRVTVEHPPFDPPGHLATPSAPPSRVSDPPEPVFVEPDAPKGFGAMLGGKKRHEEAVTRARQEHERAHAQWNDEVGRLDALHREQLADHARRETDRARALAAAQEEYEHDCAAREQTAAEQNAQLNRLISELAFDVPSAIEEYVGIVLSNSVYPTGFEVEHEYTFDLATRELTLSVSIPGPDVLPGVKDYRYVQARDEIASTALPQKEAKERYASLVAQVAVRSLHEVFEGDRAGKMRTVALTVGVKRINPGTGLPQTVPLVAVASDRASFDRLDLTNVIPSATLQHLGALVSKSPYDLSPIDPGKGVRTR